MTQPRRFRARYRRRPLYLHIHENGGAVGGARARNSSARGDSSIAVLSARFHGYGSQLQVEGRPGWRAAMPAKAGDRQRQVGGRATPRRRHQTRTRDVTPASLTLRAPIPVSPISSTSAMPLSLSHHSVRKKNKQEGTGGHAPVSREEALPQPIERPLVEAVSCPYPLGKLTKHHSKYTQTSRLLLR